MSLRGNADLSAERTLSPEHHETLAIVPPGDPTPRSTSSAPPSHGDRGKNTLSQLGHSVRLNESMSYKAPHRATQRRLHTVSPLSPQRPSRGPTEFQCLRSAMARMNENDSGFRRGPLCVPGNSPGEGRREDCDPPRRLRPAHSHDTRPSRFQHFAVNSPDQISFSFPKVGLLYCFITRISY